MGGTIVARRAGTHPQDRANGERLRGGRVVSIQGAEAELEVLCELGMVRRFRGPAAGLQEGQPIVCWLRRGPGYALAKVQPSHWASPSDAVRAAEGEAGVFGCVAWGVGRYRDPEDGQVKQESRELWRGEEAQWGPAPWSW